MTGKKFSSMSCYSRFTKPVKFAKFFLLLVCCNLDKTDLQEEMHVFKLKEKWRDLNSNTSWFWYKVLLAVLLEEFEECLELNFLVKFVAI